MIEIGKSYRVYGKMDNMKRMKPISGDQFVTNLIYADMFYIATEDHRRKFMQEIVFMNSQGTFEARQIKA